MTYRALSAFQSAVILYRRGMIAEGDTLTRNVYETAFWLGFIQKDQDDACRAFLNDERKSQRDHVTYLLEQHETGARGRDPQIEKQLKARIDELKLAISQADSVSVKEAAKRSGLYLYYGTYKHLSASSAHNSLNSLHRYLKRNPDGSYNGHIVGPDLESLIDAIPVACIGLGAALAMFCTIVATDHDEAELRALLLQIDELKRTDKVADGGVPTVL
jgi:hypothetical protein